MPPQSSVLLHRLLACCSLALLLQRRTLLQSRRGGSSPSHASHCQPPQSWAPTHPRTRAVQVKKGPLQETSPMLCDISAVPHWLKVRALQC